MSVKPFFVDALSSALDLGIATPDDVLKHVTPDLLAQHLPRPLWARLLTACIGASRVDAQIVVETIGVSNLCEHIPGTAIWACIADIGARALGGEVAATPTHSAEPAAPTIVTRPAAAKPNAPLSISGPPAPEPPKPAPPAPLPIAGPSIPAPAMEADAEETAMPSRPRTNTGGRFRQTSTNIGRLAQNNQQRRPQAAAPTPPAPLTLDPATERPRPVSTARRGETEVEVEIETELESTGGDWRNALAVEDEQLVDWSASEETLTSAGDDPSFRNKR